MSRSEFDNRSVEDAPGRLAPAFGGLAGESACPTKTDVPSSPFVASRAEGLTPQGSLPRRSFIALSLWLARFAEGSPPRTEYLRYDQAEPVLRSCKIALPAGPSAWTGWIENRDREIRSRLFRGEEDSLVNFVLFGVSFTDQPQIDPEDVDAGLVQARVRRLISDLQAPGKNERLVWLREMLAHQGYGVATPAERERCARYILANISRYLAERQQYRRVLDSASANDPVAAELYKNRGLSLDTGFRPNYAVEQALAELKRRGILTSVRRAAIIGPGLDFTDKDRGFDFYPLQTVQPFALVDSLLHLGLAKISDLRVSLFDISSQTLDHLSQAIRLARARRRYTVQLAWDGTRPWNPDVLDYWKRFGDRVGTAAEPLPVPPQIQNVQSRAVRIRPEIVTALEPRLLNIVLQHLDVSADQRFDLIVGTNVFVYYSAFERALSLLNLGSMMGVSGIFLSNSPLPECPGETLHSIGNVEVRYSQEAGDGDRVEIYSNAPLRRGVGPE